MCVTEAAETRRIAGRRELKGKKERQTACTVCSQCPKSSARDQSTELIPAINNRLDQYICKRNKL